MARQVRRRKPGRLARAATISTLWHDGGKGKDRLHLDDWTRMFEPVWKEIAQDQALGRTELRLLLLSVGYLGPDNEIRLSQRAMADLLRVTPSAVSKAMHTLVGAGLVLRAGHAYRLNSRLVAKQSLPRLVVVRHEEVAALEALEAGIRERAGLDVAGPRLRQ